MIKKRLKIIFAIKKTLKIILVIFIL